MIAKFPLVRRHVPHAIFLTCIFSAASAWATPQVATPNFSPASGVYSSAQSVEITTATSGASIAYTTDGSIPAVSGGTITHGTLYSGAITIRDTTTLSAIAFENGFLDSAVAINGYTRQPSVSPAGGISASTRPMIIPFVTTQVAAPTFSPAAGTYAGAQSITISTITPGATIIYTTDGTTPTEIGGATVDSQLYFGPVTISSTTRLNAIAFETSFADSPVTSGLYSITNAPAATLNVICNFKGSPDGRQPVASLVQGSDGNFYGTTQTGGSGNVGTVFRLTPAGILTTLVSFNGTNGSFPQAALVQGSDGNFYGTTSSGGSNTVGTVFKLTPAGGLTNLVSFTGVNGANPGGSLIQGSDGNFYGTTSSGGSSSDGTVFKLTPTGTLTTLVSFNGTNGFHPRTALVQGSDGNFYGTTPNGGGSDMGTVFKMTPSGTLTTLVSFTGANGNEPAAALVQGSDGNFYGTTALGGSGNVGTVFKLTPAGILTTLALFNGLNGSYPTAGLVQGSDGNFYGTTSSGGDSGNDGTVFKLTSSGVLTTLVLFNGKNANISSSALIQGRDGNFYGTSYSGGTSQDGTVFQLILPQAAAPMFSPAAGTYTSVQTITLTSATNGAIIRYTTDGSMPTETNGTLYSGPVSISITTAMQSIAYEAGFTDSSVTSGTYTINIPTPAPPASGGGGAPSYWFLGFLAFAGILRWKLRRTPGVLR